MGVAFVGQGCRWSVGPVWNTARMDLLAAVSEADADIAFNLGPLVLRVVVGIVFIAHGYNHIWGGGKIAGTAGWFESLGMRPGKLHAWTASIVELAAGVMLIVGLLTPLAGAAVIGVMTVAWITNHKSNGFFIFRPGEGYEYVMTLTFAGLATALIPPGEWSLDHAFDLTDDLVGAPSLLIALVAGFGGAIALLALFWRPDPKADEPA